MARFSQTAAPDVLTLINRLTQARADLMDRLVKIDPALADAALSAARVGNLDRLPLLAAGGAGEFTPARAAALDRLINDLTAARAGFLDRLDTTVSSRMARQAAATYFATLAQVSLADANSVLDSGPLAAGEYEIFYKVQRDISATGSPRVALEHRNAANNGNLIQIGHGPSADVGNTMWWWIPRRTVALNERFRLTALSATNVTLSGHAWIAAV